MCRCYWKNVMEDKELKQYFDTQQGSIFSEDFYSKCRLEILASEIKQSKRQVNFNFKNNVLSNTLL